MAVGIRIAIVPQLVPVAKEGNGCTDKNENWKPERRHNIAQHHGEELACHESIATRF